jgi:hypothetical protein
MEYTKTMYLTMCSPTSLDFRTIEKMEAVCGDLKYVREAARFAGGEAARYDVNDGTVVVRFGDLVRVHYGFRSIASCLRDVYGL